MVYLISKLWLFIAVALLLGAFVGWRTRAKEIRPSDATVAKVIAGLLALSLFAALGRVVPGRYGLYLEEALLLVAAYFGGAWLASLNDGARAVMTPVLAGAPAAVLAATDAVRDAAGHATAALAGEGTNAIPDIAKSDRLAAAGAIPDSAGDALSSAKEEALSSASGLIDRASAAASESINAAQTTVSGLTAPGLAASAAAASGLAAAVDPAVIAALGKDAALQSAAAGAASAQSLASDVAGQAKTLVSDSVVQAQQTAASGLASAVQKGQEAWTNVWPTPGSGGSSVGSGGAGGTDTSSAASLSSPEHPGERPASADSTVGDDLTLIKGIGPVNAAILNTLGIRTFAQIAAWSPANAEWIGHAVKFPGRIEREHWVSQAKLLASGVDTDHSASVRSGKIVIDALADEPLSDDMAKAFGDGLRNLHLI